MLLGDGLAVKLRRLPHNFGGPIYRKTVCWPGFGRSDASPTTNEKPSKAAVAAQHTGERIRCPLTREGSRGQRFVVASTCTACRLGGAARGTGIGAASRHRLDQASMRFLALPACRSPFHAVSRAGPLLVAGPIDGRPDRLGVRASEWCAWRRRPMDSGG